jgi:HSP20 family protein
MAEKNTDIATREQRGIARREPSYDVSNPFRMLDRFADEMDRLFDDFGFGRLAFGPRSLSRAFESPSQGVSSEWQSWSPDVEVFHRDNELVVCADLPGLTKDDVKVDVTEDRLTIQGERKREHEDKREGYYRSERSYGSFSRVIPLPEGTITDQAKATFKDGVLEVTMPAPPEQVRRGRRLDITEGKSQPAKK